MKKLISILMLTCTLQYANAQINATTITGKKITLNSDGTWVYSEGLTAGTIIDNDCEKYEYGNFNFINKTDKDIYVYVAKSNFGKYHFKISAGKSKLLNSLKIIDQKFNINNDTYSYKVLLEEANPEIQYKRLEYKLNGDIFVKICQTVDVIIEDL